MTGARYFQHADGSVVRLDRFSSYSDADNAQPVQVVPESAIVIKREDLLGVETVTFGGKVRAVIDPDPGPAGSVEWHESKAREHLSLAEHVRANPPVDEDQVKAMAAALISEGRLAGISPRALEATARSLVRGGVRVVKP